jgi:hypothetical protein
VSRHANTTWIVVITSAAISLAALGCSGDDATRPSTQVSLPGRTDVPTTPTQAQSVPSSSTSTTAVATTAMVDSAAQTKAAVAAAAVQSRQDYVYALVNFDAPDALTVLARTTAPNSPSWALTVANIEQLRSKGWRARQDPTTPSTTTVEGDVKLLDGPPATRAEVTVCTIDSGVVYEPGGAPDGSDAIVSDTITANRNRLTMVFQDGAWKLFEGSALGSWDGATSCPAT